MLAGDMIAAERSPNRDAGLRYRCCRRCRGHGRPKSWEWRWFAMTGALRNGARSTFDDRRSSGGRRRIGGKAQRPGRWPAHPGPARRNVRRPAHPRRRRSFGIEAQSPLDGSPGTVDATGVEVVDPDADTLEFMQFLMADIQAPGTSTSIRPARPINTPRSWCSRTPSTAAAVGPWPRSARSTARSGDQQSTSTARSTTNSVDGSAPRRFRPGLRDRPRGRPPHPGDHRHQRRGPQRPGQRSRQRRVFGSPGVAGRLPGRGLGLLRQPTSDRGTRPPIIEDGDIDEGLAAAAAVGDDRIQAQAGMRIDPHPGPMARPRSGSPGSSRATTTATRSSATRSSST